MRRREKHANAQEKYTFFWFFKLKYISPKRPVSCIGSLLQKRLYGGYHKNVSIADITFLNAKSGSVNKGSSETALLGDSR